MSALIWNGADTTRQIETAGAEGLLAAAELVLQDANELVPYDTGALKSSGVVSIEAEHLQACVSYDTPYAVRVHEHPEYHFLHNRRGKWLEISLNELAAAVLERVAAPIRARLGV